MRKVLLIACSSVLVIGFTIFILEKTHVINIYHKSLNPATDIKPVNTIDYSPATTNDNANNDQVKQNSLNSTPQASSLNITITRAMHNTSKDLIVRTLVEGVTNGSCTLELSQNGIIRLTKQASISQQNNVYTCNGFDIPQTELPGVGEWTIKLSASDGTNNTSTTQNIMIEK